MKRIASITAVILVIVALGFVSYYYFVYDAVDPETGEKVGFREFLPFGSSKEGESGGFIIPEGEPVEFEETGENPWMETGIVAAPDDFVKISRNPVAGAIAIETATSTVIRYVERATGHIYDFEAATGREYRVTNTTIPKLQEAYWYPGGESLVVRSLDESDGSVNSIFVRLLPAGGDGLRGTELIELESNVSAVAPLSAEKLFYLTRNPAGTNGYAANADGSAANSAFRSPFREWIAEPINGGSVLLSEKAASYADGYVYTLNLLTETLHKLAGPLLGLTASVSPDGSQAFLSYRQEQGGFVTRIVNPATGASIIPPVPTFAEKCVWKSDSSGIFCAVPRKGVNADSLDLWYQGVISFSDDLWFVTVPTGGVREVFSPQNETDGEIDMIDLGLSPSGSFAYFINKKDSMLWVINLGSAETQ